MAAMIIIIICIKMYLFEYIDNRSLTSIKYVLSANYWKNWLYMLVDISLTIWPQLSK